ncbi:MAG TPA: hypothetical protein VGN72_00665 [Tepidisphaeraceae bacterium]|jgi:predicted DNA-binding protein YlxM (UPF0122 family)|nr:hypothetical protein [Tepidisphaeraceae bacterium]
MFKTKLKRASATVAMTLFLSASVSLAQWSPPDDKKLSEKQMQSYVATMQDLRELWTTAGKRLENASGLGAMAIASQTGDKWNEILAKHNLTEDEWTWVHEQATQSWIVQGMLTSASEDLNKQKQQIADRIAAAKQKLAEQEAALKSGRRAVADDERQSVVDDLKNQQNNAQEEVKGYDEQAERASAEAKDYDTEAATYERQMKNPPADVAAEDRASYIDEQKAQMETSRERAKESRDREAEAKQAAATARTKAEKLGKQVADPTLVLDEDEQAALKERHERDIESTKAEIARHEQSLADLAPMEAMNKEILDQMKQGIPQENLDLAKKYSDQIAKAFGEEAKK